MKLSEYNRVKFSKYIRNLYIKDHCELCGSKENLELHHNYQFVLLLKYVVEDKLNLEFIDDISCYTKNQLELIELAMLGLQTKMNYTTVCRDCHKKIETKKVFNKNMKQFEREQLKKTKKKKNVYKYLNSILNKRLYKEDKQKLIEILNVKDERGRQNKGYTSLKKYLKETFNLDLLSKRTKSTRYWMITKGIN